MPWAAQQLGPQAGPATRPTRCAHLSPLTTSLTLGPRCQLRLLPRRQLGRASGRRWRGPARAEVRGGSASTSRLHCYHPRTLYLSLSTSATQMADGRVGRP